MTTAVDSLKAPTGRSLTITLRRILDAAEAEFGTKGLDGTKVEHIAKRAGVSKQLIYHYFDGKDDLYAEVLAHIETVNLEKFLTIDYDSLSPAEAMRAYILALFDQYRAQPVSGVITLDQSLHSGAQIKSNRKREKLQKALQEHLSAVIARGKAEGVFHSEVDVERIHFMSVILVTGCISSRAMFLRYTGQKTNPDDDLDSLREYTADFILRAMRA